MVIYQLNKQGKGLKKFDSPFDINKMFIEIVQKEQLHFQLFIFCFSFYVLETISTLIFCFQQPKTGEVSFITSTAGKKVGFRYFDFFSQLNTLWSCLGRWKNS
ncbi:unnamed protein product [Paramecium primaurelia]|uniref:Uncharacterized protein n=1 Tax=Paramecium primaurelia TaxID=5886 RepID=A0A8S1PFM1_PARPR|nr:unnamed protein product [Paramecium primaurelia]